MVVPSDIGLLILKTNHMMGLRVGCYLCCYIFQIFSLQGSLALQFAILQRLKIRPVTLDLSGTVTQALQPT